MKKYVAISIVLLVFAIGFLSYQNGKLEKDNNRLASNQETLLTENRHYKINDSLDAISSSVLELKVSELEKHRVSDLKLIKELKLRPKDVEYIIKTEIRTNDSLVYKIDSIGCFHYKDNWLKVDACLGDSSMVIESRDSIAQVIHAIYKHKFLWWRWGIKEFRQEVVNFNPKSKIGYSEIVRIGK